MKYKDLTIMQEETADLVLLIKYYFHSGLSRELLGEITDYVGKAFMLQAAEVDELRAVFNDEEIEKINTKSDCENYLRFVEFAKLNKFYSVDNDLSNIVNLMLECFSGIEIAKSDGYKRSNKRTIELLFKAADEGNVKSLVTLGMIQLFGVGLEKNEKGAIECFERAGDWNNLDAIRILAYYYKGRDEISNYKYNVVLQALTVGKNYYSFIKQLDDQIRQAEKTGITAHLKAEAARRAKIHSCLGAAFISQALNREKTFTEENYIASVARVIYNTSISQNDIMRLLEAPDKALWKDITNLFVEPAQAVLLDAEFPLPAREKARASIRGYFTERLKGINSKPLLICCESECVKSLLIQYVREITEDIYHKTIDAASAERERVSALDHRFNVVATTMIASNRNNFALLVNNIEGVTVDTRKSFLELLRTRKRLYISSLGISVDIGGIKLMAFTRDVGKVEPEIRGLCEEIVIGNLTDNEKESLLKIRLPKLSDEYKIDISADSAVLRAVCTRISDIDDAMEFIVALVREAGYEGKDSLLITDEHLEAYLKEHRPKTIGFSGK